MGANQIWPCYRGDRVRLDIQLVNFGKSPAISDAGGIIFAVFTDVGVPVDKRISYAFAIIPRSISGYSSFIPHGSTHCMADRSVRSFDKRELNYVKGAVLGWVEAGIAHL